MEAVIVVIWIVLGHWVFAQDTKVRIELEDKHYFFQEDGTLEITPHQSHYFKKLRLKDTLLNFLEQYYGKGDLVVIDLSAEDRRRCQKAMEILYATCEPEDYICFVIDQFEVLGTPTIEGDLLIVTIRAHGGLLQGIVSRTPACIYGIDTKKDKVLWTHCVFSPLPVHIHEKYVLFGSEASCDNEGSLWICNKKDGSIVKRLTYNVCSYKANGDQLRIIEEKPLCSAKFYALEVSLQDWKLQSRTPTTLEEAIDLLEDE